MAKDRGATATGQDSAVRLYSFRNASGHIVDQNDGWKTEISKEGHAPLLRHC